MPLEAIQNLIHQDLKSIDQCIILRLQSKIPLIKQIIEYILTCGGKRIRPTVLLLCSKMFSEQNHQSIELASVIELIHTATLLHDDVVDRSTLRRGHKTAHTIWGNNSSVLIGDFLYSRAFQIVVDLKHQEVLNIFANATHYIAEGEIMQLANCNNPDTTESFYFEIIQRKTAKLFEVAAHLGALLATQNDVFIKNMIIYGLHLGLAYQLIDDALDYSRTSQQTGKDIGQDLAEGKATLPFIYALSQTQGAALELLRNSIKNGASHKLNEILDIIESTKAIQYTADTAKKHVENAKMALANIPFSPYRKALEDLSDFVVERDY